MSNKKEIGSNSDVKESTNKNSSNSKLEELISDFVNSEPLEKILSKYEKLEYTQKYSLFSILEKRTDFTTINFLIELLHTTDYDYRGSASTILLKLSQNKAMKKK